VTNPVIVCGHRTSGRAGDDRLGYDFRIHDGHRTYLYEVKASVGSGDEILLGESEVQRASHLEPGETYIIVYVSDGRCHVVGCVGV
jgi:hypothetical protein